MIILILGGIMFIGASIFNWLWFFRGWKVRIIDKILGRSLTRIFYFTLGCVFLVSAFFIVFRA